MRGLPGTRGATQAEKSGWGAQAAGALLRPLDGLRERVDGLQALLHDPSRDQGSKMAEVSSLVGQMQQLHALAERHQLRQHEAAAPPTPGGGGGEGAANLAANGAANHGAAGGGAAGAGAAPERAAPADGAGGGLGMGGLDSVDLDGLLRSLEGRAAGLEDPD